ncbi:hypothetical protein C8J30_1113 [Rhodobacter viridis]|uniref:Transposase n=1 Tax=Rhodobacter viridis TaxID=1054202 RepID=A0A318U2R1_9RHOB|nr:hypothetical protein [Rhodobacter viridis]PYF08675.1 hypothetical protein C8J30_1113 [Rhodobacter viridis]
MLDEGEGGDVVVWGCPVITADNERRIWPDELKAMAVKKIEAGTKIVTVAKEIGANESLVAKGARAELPELSRRGRPQGKAPQFVEVMAPSEPARHEADGRRGRGRLSDPDRRRRDIAAR